MSRSHQIALKLRDYFSVLATTHRRLLAVIARLGRGQPLADELPGVRQEHVDALGSGVGQVVAT